jgi:hypothetical protein
MGKPYSKSFNMVKIEPSYQKQHSFIKRDHMLNQHTYSTTGRLALAITTLAISGCSEGSHHDTGAHDDGNGHHNQSVYGASGSLSFVTTVDTSVQFLEASTTSAIFTISHCDGTEDSVTSTGAIDMTTYNTAETPPGGVCLFHIELQELSLSGRWFDDDGLDGGGFNFEAPVVTTELWATMPFYTDDISIVFELGGDIWPTAEELLMIEGTNETLEADTPSYETMLAAIENNSVLYRDINDDGALSEDDLSKSPLAMAFEDTETTTY